MQKQPAKAPAKRTQKRATQKKGKLVAKKQSKRSIFASASKSLFSRSNEPKIPLDMVFPGVSVPSASEADYKLGAPQLSTLSNGIKVITQKSAIPVSHISLSIASGSRFELQRFGETGMNHFLQRQILRSTTNRVHSTLIRDMAKLGADLSASAGRENFMISATTPTRVNPVLGAIADCVKHASFDPHDVFQEAAMYQHDISARALDADVLLDEALHHAAFGNGQGVDADGNAIPGASLGNKQHMPFFLLDKINPTYLASFKQKFFTADRMTLGAVGVDHDAFVALAEEMLGDIPVASEEQKKNIPNIQTQYLAGNLRALEYDGSKNSTIALAWNAPSIVSPHLAAANVLQSVLGGGSSFSSGGPGKGMHTRFYRNILQEHDWVSSVDSWYSTYTDAGLLGMTANVPSESLAEYVDVMLEEMAVLPTQISDEEVTRGKNMLISQLHNHMEDGLARCEELTRNVQIFGKDQLPTYLDQIAKISTKDVRDVAAMIIQQDITVATYGDASALPRDISM